MDPPKKDAPFFLERRRSVVVGEAFVGEEEALCEERASRRTCNVRAPGCSSIGTWSPGGSCFAYSSFRASPCGRISASHPPTAIATARDIIHTGSRWPWFGFSCHRAPRQVLTRKRASCTLLFVARRPNHEGSELGFGGLKNLRNPSCWVQTPTQTLMQTLAQNPSDQVLQQREATYSLLSTC